MVLDVINMIDQEIEKAQQRSAGTGPTFFVLKSGEKALVRPLLNLNQAVVILKHDFFNQVTKKFEVNAICASSLQMDGCAHCLAAEQNKKLKPVRYFIVPVYVHKIQVIATGKLVTFTMDDKEQEVSGVRYLQLKATSPILATLLSFYREEHSITQNDFVIERKGESLDTTYTVIAKAPKPFSPGVEIPEQTENSILLRIADVCPFKLIGDDTPQAAPAVSSPSSKGKSVIDDDF